MSGTDTVGHTVTTSTAFTVDAVAPAISNATITGGYQNQRFSAHSGFKVVSFSFGANKRLDIDGGTLAATVGGYPFGCAYNPDGGVYYACTYNVAGTELAGGTPISTLSQATMPILLSAVDEVGNQATAQVTPPSVVFDFQAPYLTASSASPAPDASVGAGQSELIELQPSETLATGDGGTTLWPAVTFSGPISLDGGTGITIEVTIPASQSATGTETSLVAMTDLVGNTAVDAGPVFLVDTVEPVLTNVATYSLAGTAETSFSAESTYNTVVLKFNATKSLDYPHPAISLLDAICSLPDGGSPDASDCAFQCGAWTATAPNYTCNYAVTGHEQTSAGLPVSTLANATFPVTIEGEDEANNLVSGSTSVTFDFMPPALAASPAISYLPAPNMFTADGGLAACAGKQNVLTSVTAATTCTDIRASFAMTEQLSSNPVVTAADGGIAFSQTSVSGVSYIYDGTTTVAGTPPDNPSYGLMIGATDLVGNPATLRPAMQTLALDTTAPAVPNTAIGGPILYTRIPWGSAATNEIATYFVQGDAGSSEPNGSIFAYDGPGTTYDNIGQGWVGVDGSFGPLTLLRDDRAAVYLSAVDRAGNGSPLVATHNVSWTATFNGKTPGNVVTNPNIALANVDDPLGVTSVNLTAGSDAFGALNPGSGQATEIASYAALSSVNVSSLVTAFSTAPWVSVAGANKPVPTYGQAFVFDTARGVTVSFGGDSGGNNDTWEWNGSMWNQATPFSSPADRAQPCAAYDSARGVMVMFGGQTFDDTWEWNGINWTQLSPATSPVARYGSAMAYDAARGVSVLFGGQSTSGQGLNDTWEWTGTTWRQIFPTSSPPARSYHGMVYDSARGVAVLFGGTSSLGLLNDTWEWNGFVWTQVNCSGNPCLPLSSTPVARESQAMAFDAVRGLTVLFGGTLAGSVFAGDTWQWNGNAWIQSSPIASPSGRTSAAMAYDSARGVSVMFGGLFPQEIAGQTAYYVLNELWEWNGSTWTERTQPFELPNLPPLTNPPARSDHAMVVDGARGVAVLFGGIGDGNVLMNDTWEWNGSIWTQRSPATKPAIRADMGMVYDSARGVTVLFGGENEISGPDLNDTWEWNGTSWTQKTVNGAVTSPVARSYVSMVFDEARGVSVLFGGEEYTAANSSCSGPTQWAFNCNDTWEWNGSVWVQMTPTQSPPARWSAPMAYDSARGVSVLFGGNSLQGAVLTDTWEWNGQNWTQRTPALSPPSVTYGAMAYDAERGVSLLVGAVTSALEVWSWNGSTWTQESPPILPSLRYSIGMAYDGARGQAVLFGGAGGGYSDVLGDTWLLRSDLAGRSTDLLQFGFGNTGDTFATAQIAGVSITLVAGGTGYASTTRESDGSATPGVAIAGWDVSTGGRWHILASNAADSTAPVPMTYVTNSDWGISHDFFAENQFIDVAVFPLQSTGNGANGGRVALESPQMTVLYQHVESICSVSELSSCTCGSDETVCGPDGGLVCSDISADPLNCGGCLAADAGLVCANGTWCLNGRCACPGTEVTCEGVCTDTTSDPLNCGGCNAADAGYLCGPFRPCNASHCSTCQAGQALDAGTCGNDILIRTSSNQTGSSGVATIAAGSATAGDSLFVVVAPAVSGFFTSTVASNSGGIWSLVGLGNDSGQYLAVYSRTATASDSGSTITVTLETLAGDGGLIPAAAGLNATLIDVYSQSGATISVDANAFGGSGIAADLLDAGITTAGTAPAIAATGPNEVVLIAAVQQGSTVSTLPSGVATTKLTQNGGFLTGYYSLVLPGVAPTQQFTGGSSTSTWEIAQIALASSAH